MDSDNQPYHKLGTNMQANWIEYRSVTSQRFIGMETGSKQFQAVRGSVIATVANNTSARLQPTARSLVQISLVLESSLCYNKRPWFFFFAI